MKRVKLVVSYDGTSYHGWQLQPNGITIESVLNQALSELLGEPMAVTGASRTDAGVHALGNVAVFDTVHRMPADKICFALNQRLPDDIRVLSSKEVPLNWHPRHCSSRKTYEYSIQNGRVEYPIYRLYSHFCYIPLDVELMRKAAAYLVGEHDFTSFCSVGAQTDSKVRTILGISVTREGSLVKIRVCGNGFLYNMVRIIAGTLMQAGTGAFPPETVKEILEAKNRQKAGPTAPARGLTLVQLDYGPSGLGLEDNC